MIKTVLMIFGLLAMLAVQPAGCARFFEGPVAPFSWEPEEVQVLDSGTLALGTGPVHDPQGQRIGTFNSIHSLFFGEVRKSRGSGRVPRFSGR